MGGKGHFVFLGSRDVARGEAAAATLDAAKVQVVQLDLTSKASIEQAAKTVGDACGEGGLEGKHCITKPVYPAQSLCLSPSVSACLCASAGLCAHVQ